MEDKNEGQNEIPWWELAGIPEFLWSELEAEAALAKEATEALEDIITDVCSAADKDIIYAMDKVTAWTEEELAYLKALAEEAFVAARDRLMSEGLELDDAVRLALDEAREFMEGAFAGTRIAAQAAIAIILEELEEEEEEEEDSTAAIVQKVKDSIGGLFSGIIEALAICFEWLGERLEDLLRIPSNTLFEWLADIMPGGLRE